MPIPVSMFQIITQALNSIIVIFLDLLWLIWFKNFDNFINSSHRSPVSLFLDEVKFKVIVAGMETIIQKEPKIF